MNFIQKHVSKSALVLSLMLALCVLIAISSSPEPKHLFALRQLLEHVLPENNSYQNMHRNVEWKGSHNATKYACHTDCCGLLDSVLIHSYHYTRQDLKKWLGQSRPRASTYYKAIFNNHGFEHIINIHNVLPGDVIALCYPPGLKSNGHIMFVNALPEQIASSAPIIENTKQWAVPIIDCTGACHGPQDTRHLSNGQHSSGIGKGIFRIYTDNNGNIVGYSWAIEASSEFHGEDMRKIAIGRLLRT
mgnify:CR=1 FL=1